MENFNWQKLVANLVGAAAFGYGISGWKGAVASVLTALANLFQMPPHKENGNLDAAIAALEKTKK